FENFPLRGQHDRRVARRQADLEWFFVCARAQRNSLGRSWLLSGGDDHGGLGSGPGQSQLRRRQHAEPALPGETLGGDDQGGEGEEGFEAGVTDFATGMCAAWRITSGFETPSRCAIALSRVASAAVSA